MIHLNARGRLVAAVAHAQAGRMGHARIGTEHLLLALAKDGTAARALADLGVEAAAVEREVLARAPRPPGRLGPDDAEALRTLGIDLDAVRERIEAAFGPGALQPPAPRRPRLTPQAKKAIEMSLREARALGADAIAPEHILLGVNAVEAGLGVRILRDLGASALSVRLRALEELRRAS